jgi:hypothetical protein
LIYLNTDPADVLFDNDIKRGKDVCVDEVEVEEARAGWEG